MPRPAEGLLVPKPPRAVRSVYALCLILVVGLIWSALAPVDVYVRAVGLVRPENEVVRVMISTGGRVASVRHHEGDRVGAGDALLLLEGTELRLTTAALIAEIEGRDAQLKQLDRKLAYLEAVHDAEQARIQSDLDALIDDLQRRDAAFDTALAAGKIRLDRAVSDHEAARRLRLEGLISAEDWGDSFDRLRLAELEYARIGTEAPDRSGLEHLERTSRLAAARFESDKEEIRAREYPIRIELVRLRSRLVLAQEDEAERTIRSPVTGRLVEMSILHPGEYVRTGDLIATVEPESARRLIEAILESRHAQEVLPGQEVRVVMNEGRVFHGRVRSVSPDVRTRGPDAGRYRVLIEPEAPDLRLGLAVEVRFVTRTERLLSLLLGRLTRSFDQIGG